MRIALVQLASPDGESADERVERAGQLVEGLDRVDLVVLPELWAPGYFAFDDYAAAAEPLDGSVARAAAGWARALGAHVQAGSVLERGQGGRLHNTALLFAPDGSLALTYRKVHVFGYQSLEARLLSPGEGAEVSETALGPVAMSTCYDLRFPELYRHLTDGGAQLVIVPAAWPAARLDHWRLFTRARALENEFFLIGCGAAGEQHGVALSGHSVVVDPWGRVVAEAGADEQVLYADIDLGEVARTRAEFPVLADRRIRAEAVFERDRAVVTS